MLYDTGSTRLQALARLASHFKGAMAGSAYISAIIVRLSGYHDPGYAAALTDMLIEETNQVMLETKTWVAYWFLQRHIPREIFEMLKAFVSGNVRRNQRLFFLRGVANMVARRAMRNTDSAVS